MEPYIRELIDYQILKSGKPKSFKEVKESLVALLKDYPNPDELVNEDLFFLIQDRYSHLYTMSIP